MGQPMDQWTQRVQSARDEETQRSLMAEVALWRARRLHDVVASRGATLALSKLHEQLDEREAAVREARSLLSLCQTPPVASREELALAKTHLEHLGGVVPPMPGMDRSRGRRGASEERPARSERNDRREPREPREPRGARGAKSNKPDPMDRARAAANADNANQVHEIAQGRTGPTWALLRVHADLGSLASISDPADLQAGLAQLRDAVGRALSLRKGGSQARERGAPDADDPLSQLLGQAVPRKRGPRLRVIERFAEEHPEQVDALAAAVLQHHVSVFGLEQAAPWLVGTVGKAKAAGEAPLTDAAIAKLGAKGSTAVLAYDEWAFARLVRVVTAARTGGFEIGSLRRGVLSRGEPVERKLWTLRIRKPDAPELMAVVAPHSTEPYTDGQATELAERVRALCPRALILATGSGNAGLRDAARACGLAVLDQDADDTAILTALEAHGSAVSSPRQGDASAPDLLVEALRGDAPTPEAIAEVLGGFRRATRSFRVAERAQPTDVATAALLRAVPQAVEAEESLAEGTTLAVRVAAAGGAETRAVLEGPLQDRYGGPAVVPVADLATVLVADGWQVFRVLRGPTRREREQHPVLETLSEAMGGVWRILVRREDVRGEVWYVDGLAAEGRAGVPQLLIEDRQRAVVLPVDPELIGWYGGLGGPEAIGWTGAEGDALKTAVSAWQPSAPR